MDASRATPLGIIWNIHLVIVSQSQLNSNIHGLRSTEFSSGAKSNSHKNNYTVKLNRTFDFQTPDFCKTAVETNNKFFKVQITSV